MKLLMRRGCGEGKAVSAGGAESGKRLGCREGFWGREDGGCCGNTAVANRRHGPGAGGVEGLDEIEAAAEDPLDGEDEEEEGEVDAEAGDEGDVCGDGFPADA